MTEQGHTAADCMRAPLSDALPERCQQLKRGFGECRRGMIDMRKRFRGNAPFSAKLLAESDAAAAASSSSSSSSSSADSGKGYQLYAGGSAFGARERGETDGTGTGPRDWREVENERYRAEQKALEEQSRRDGA
jgi:cytochrome c oxidase assembly factor 5